MNYILKKAVIVTGRTLKNGNLHTVRVLPEMGGILETDLLPMYPNFFSQNNTQYKSDDQVWVVCNDDFNVGFILGLLQPPAGEDVSSIISRINKAEVEANFRKSGYNELSIIKIGGKSIIFENNVSGQSGTVYSTGVVVLVSDKGDIWVSNKDLFASISSKGDLKVVGKAKYEKFVSDTKDSGKSIERVAEKRVESAGALVNSSSGDLRNITASNSAYHSTGDSEELVGKKKSSIYGQGRDTKIASGGDSELVILGDYSLTVVAGNIKFMASAGIDIKTAGTVSITSTMIDMVAPTIKMPMGMVAPSSGPMCALPFCLMTGAPHSGNIAVGI